MSLSPTSISISKAFLTGMLISIGSSACLAQQLSTAEIARRSLGGTVTLIGIGADGDTLSMGSGFVLRSDGIVVTNYHVLAGAESAIVTLRSGKSFRQISVLGFDSSADIVLLRIPGARLFALPSQAEIPPVGSRITVIGNPLSLSQTVSEGIISATRIIERRELVQISAPISHGSSGGPVLSEKGRVFAIATSYLKGGQQLNFATPLKYALAILSNNGPDRSVRSVFRDVTPITNDDQPDTTVMIPTPRPKTDIGGTYWVKQIFKSNGFVSEGLLVGNSRVGLLVLSPFKAGKQNGPSIHFILGDFRTNVEGQVVLRTGPYIYDGFQTDNGFRLSETGENDSGAQMTTLTGERVVIPLSDNNGLYKGSARTTFFFEGDAATNPTEWDVEAAVFIEDETIYLDLYMQNRRGGSSGISGYSPLRNGETFTIASKNGKRLEGRVRNGTITANWSDRRGPGEEYKGKVNIVRQ